MKLDPHIAEVTALKLPLSTYRNSYFIDYNF